jgi:hypothetical protein
VIDKRKLVSIRAPDPYMDRLTPHIIGASRRTLFGARQRMAAPVRVSRFFLGTMGWSADLEEAVRNKLNLWYAP